MMNKISYYFTCLLFIVFVYSFSLIPAYSQTKQETRQLKLAKGYERSGEYEKALAIYEKLYRQNPDNHVIVSGIKKNYSQLKRYDVLIKFLKTQIRQQSGNIVLIAELAEAYYKNNDLEQARIEWYQIIEKQPESLNSYRLVANSMLRNRLFDEAITIYLLARKQTGGKAIFIIELASLYAARMNYADATLEYINYLKSNIRQFPYVERRLLKFPNEPETNLLIANVIENELLNGKAAYEIYLRKLLSPLYLRNDQYAKAFEQAKRIDALSKKDGQEILKFAELAYSEKAYPIAEKAYVEIIEQYHNSPNILKAKYGLAMTYEKQDIHSEKPLPFAEQLSGIVEENPIFSSKAIDVYQNLIQNNPTSPWVPKAYYQIGEIKFTKFFDLDGALAAYEMILSKHPKHPLADDARFRSADCWVAKGDLAKAENLFNQVLKKNQKFKDKAQYRLSKIDFYELRFKECKEKLEKLISPENPAGLFVNDALDFLLFLEENTYVTDAALANYATAEKLTKQRKYAEAIVYLQTIINQHLDDPLQDDSRLKIGELLTQMKRYEEAITDYRELIKLFPESSIADQTQKRIGEVYEYGLEDIERAIEEYALVLVNYPDSLLLNDVRKKIRILNQKILKKDQKS